jgi:hypothetical protein
MSIVAAPPKQTNDGLNDLLKKRAALEEKIHTASKSGETLERASAALAAVDDELRAFDLAEREAWERWSEDPSENPPAPRHEQRRELERRRALAIADQRSAESAAAVIQPRHAKIFAELQQVVSEIFGVRLENVLAETSTIEKRIYDAALIVHNEVTSLQGLVSALRLETIEARNRGDNGAAAAMQLATVRVEGLKAPAFQRTNGDIDIAASAWREKIR